jgi:hypothetical protein
MTATNHGVMGMLIGAYLPLPIAIPLAFASHFVLDALPHFGIKRGHRDNSKAYKLFVCADACIALSFAVLSASLGRWDMFIVGWVAYSPDFMWVVGYYKHKKLNVKATNRFAKFHKNIQKYEKPWGAFVELALLIVTLPITLTALFN